MKNITAIEKTAMKKQQRRNNSKNNNCLAVFFGIIFFDDMLNSPRIRTRRKQGWFVGVSPYFLGAEIKTTTENTTLTERYTTGTRTLDATDVTFTASPRRSSRGC